MGLGIYYKEDDEFVLATTGEDFGNPITTTHDGKQGDTVTRCLYLRNDDSDKWYSNIQITPLDLVEANPYGDVGYSETGWGVKLSAGSDEPTVGEWEDIDWGDFIEMNDVGSDSGANTTTYYPFWYLITCPPNTDAINKTDIVLETSYTENSII